MKDLIFIDESGVNLAMVRLYARSLKGERAKGPKPTKRGKNVSIIGAMSVNEILTSVNLIGGTDAITFEAFIIRKLVPQLWKGACVVMDNCPIHLGEEVKKTIEKKGAKLIYLSPYFCVEATRPTHISHLTSESARLHHLDRRDAHLTSNLARHSFNNTLLRDSSRITYNCIAVAV